MSRCGAKTRAGTPCKQIAGHGTDHVGKGRCKLHGGKSPVKHGLHAKQGGVPPTRVRQAIQEAEQNPDPLNVLPELAKARGVLQVWLDDFDAFVELRDRILAEQDVELPDKAIVKLMAVEPGALLAALDLISKVTHRVQQAQASNHISRAHFLRVMSEMGRVVEAHVQDELVRERIKDGWLGIRLS